MHTVGRVCMAANCSEANSAAVSSYSTEAISEAVVARCSEPGIETLE